jgi:putative DNA primase/helicase
MRPAGDGRVRFKPNRAQVNDLLDALKAIVNLDPANSAPTWLCDHTVPAIEIVACRNGLLDLQSGQLLPHTPAFFSHNALDFDFDPNAKRPEQWFSFLSDLWRDDGESIATLQEVFGLCLTANTRYQKAFMLVGPPRSGKSTIGTILTGLVGRDNVVGPTLTDLAAEFGMATLIGKRVACIPDARIGKGTNRDKISERLLSITGEDIQNVNRKHRDYWTGRLQVRFIVLSNELPEFDERSGALAGRFIVLALRRSFFGKEDLKLTDKLLMELPGILNWAIEGWWRLSARGHFVQPLSGVELVDELENLSSPIKAFVKERCIVAPNRSIECHRLYEAWRIWNALAGQFFLPPSNLFSRDLHAAIPGISVTQPRRNGKQVRVFNGIDLK